MKNCPLLLLQTAASSSAAAVLALLVAWVQQPLFDTCSDGLQKYLLGMGVAALVLSRLAKQSIRFRILHNRNLLFNIATPGTPLASRNQQNKIKIKPHCS